MDDSILEPHTLYHSSLKQKVADATSNYFEQLVKSSEIDEQANAATVKKLNKTTKQRDESKKRLNSIKVLQGFLVFLFIILLVAAIVCTFCAVYLRSDNNWEQTLYILITVAVCSFVAAIATILIVALVVNKKVKERQNEYNNLEKKVNQLTDECYSQVAALNALFDWQLPPKIIREAVPLLQIDDCFDIKKFDYLNRKYNFGENDDVNSSIVCVLSGSLKGNPFLLLRSYDTYMSTKIYKGSLTISWVERTVDSRGRTMSVTRTQTLVATLEKPAPAYEYFTYLVYANDAAPDLTFKREPCGIKSGSEKDFKNYVKKESKALNSKAEKAVQEGSKFTPLVNTEFETLFHAWDRDNETQFRLMFTPLAQENIVKLIKSNDPYGDDFTFHKRKCLNYIVTQHAQATDILCRPSSYYHYDANVIRQRFNNYVNEYFKSLYFDLAPLLSVPIYQQQKPIEYIYKTEFDRYYTGYEEEAIVNTFPQINFLHPSSSTNGILKVRHEKKTGRNTDHIIVTAHSYKAEPRLDYVPMLGGDGYTHNVPVHWEEFIPLQRETRVGVKRINTTRYDFNQISPHLEEKLGLYGNGGNAVFANGFFAYLADAEEDEVDSVLDELFGYNENSKKEDK